MDKIDKSEEQWRRELDPEAFRILRGGGTERPFTGAFWECTGAEGVYACRGCGLALFDARHKYDSGSGWPSFYQPVREEHIEERDDSSLDVHRIEALCARCRGHLGHVFPDGPAPTGLRYCINSASLTFEPEE